MTDEGGEDEYEFLCPDCGEGLVVNASMKDALVDRGCVICGTDVEPSNFTDASAADAG